MKASGFNQQQLEKMKSHPGFIAALDQSGGSTPGALRLYGVKDSAWSNEAEMFALVHQMRKRIISSPSFNGERIIGAILFEDTMDRDIESLPTADYLWNVKQVVPFLKIDTGLAAEQDGVQLMKPIPALAELLTKAKAKRIFGTKMRSVIKRADEAGIKSIVNQQFEVAEQILSAGLLPIVEPEVDVHSTDKAKSEELLKAAILEKLNQLTADEFVMLKLTLPEQDDFYLDLIRHPKVVRVVALSGGYSQEDADDRLRKDHGMVASFSRALLEGLSAQQSDAEFNSVLEKSIQNIFDASNTKQPTIIESDWNRITTPLNPKVAGIISQKDSRHG
jgi:fructose-bisphosphate aldolase class I